MNTIVFFSIAGYLCGSALFEKVFALLFHRQEAASVSADRNPGVFNAFKYGGFGWGVFCLIGDLSKGIIPVLLYLHFAAPSIVWMGLPFVLVSPVLGHLYPIFFHFQGGKGIAVTFGVLLALWIAQITPAPVLSLAALFLFFKLVIPIYPDFYLTVLVYLLLPVTGFLEHLPGTLPIGLLFISLSVLGKLAFSVRPEAGMEVRFLWKR